MSAFSAISLLFLHPLEFHTLVQFRLFHERKRDISALHEHPTSGWDRRSMRRCWQLSDFTGRSFSAVIKEIEGDLARTVGVEALCLQIPWWLSHDGSQICLFYLVLRGLDTIEDDMTIPDEIKQPLLRSFHEFTTTTGWTFTGNGPDEKDRQLLVEYDVVVDEVNLLRPE